MTNVLIISDTRVPTTDGKVVHGLGATVVDFARYLKDKDYGVEVLAGPGSSIEDILVDDSFKTEQEFLELEETFLKDWDVIIDFSHQKFLGGKFPDLPIIDFSVDREARPKVNPVFNSFAHKEYWNMKGMVIPSPVDVHFYEFNRNPQGYLLYLAPMHPMKGFKTALYAAKQTGLPFVFAGPGTEKIKGGRGAVFGKEKRELLQNAGALLFPSSHEAGPRTVLEAMSCGTPVLCYNYGGAADYVDHGVSGFCAETQEEFISLIPEVLKLDRYGCRRQAMFFKMTTVGEELEKVLQKVIEGERWSGY